MVGLKSVSSSPSPSLDLSGTLTHTIWHTNYLTFDLGFLSSSSFSSLIHSLPGGGRVVQCLCECVCVCQKQHWTCWSGQCSQVQLTDASSTAVAAAAAIDFRSIEHDERRPFWTDLPALLCLHKSIQYGPAQYSPAATTTFVLIITITSEKVTCRCLCTDFGTSVPTTSSSSSFFHLIGFSLYLLTPNGWMCLCISIVSVHICKCVSSCVCLGASLPLSAAAPLSL